MVIECTPYSQCGGERSNPQAEARKGEPMSRNASELDSASLRYLSVVKPPEKLKPAIVGEGTFESNQRTLRGGWRWHVGKDTSRNLRDPFGQQTERESDSLIVAKKRLINAERRGLTVGVQTWRENAAA